MRATAAGAKGLSGLIRRVEEDSSGMIEAARVGGVGVQHWLLSATGPVAEIPARQQEASIDYMVLAVDGADLNSTAQFYIRAFGMDLLCAQQVQAGEERMRSVALSGTGWTLVIVAQDGRRARNCLDVPPGPRRGDRPYCVPGAGHSCDRAPGNGKRR